MAAVTVNGVETAYQQMGEGPDLVLVHGLAASRAFWFAQYAMPLSRQFRVTLYDLRGHGYSGRPDRGYDAATMAADLDGLLQHLAIERCALVGHSYGGAVALEFAGRCPQRVSRLAIMDTKINRLQPQQMLADCPDPLSPFELEIAARFGYDWERETQLGLRFLEAVARWRVQGGDTAARDAFTPFGEGRGAQRAARQWLDLLDNTGAREEFQQPGLSREALAALAPPLLAIYGGRSRCLPSCRALAALLPAAEIEIIPQGGHFFPISHAGAVASRLARFLGVSPAAAAPTPPLAAAAAAGTA